MAVVVVGLAISLYAASIPTGFADGSGHDVADVTLSRVYDAVTDHGIAEPSALSSARTAGPAGYQLNVTLSSADGTWRTGPHPPSDAARATRRVSVRRGAGAALPGRLTVVVWT